jgi:protein-L-isoaspartate(D-aspartate) O-methyltransferase
MSSSAEATADSAAMRRAMVNSQLRPNNVTDVRLLSAMERIPREPFLPTERRAVAYTDRAVPLGNGRALNPPLTTALLLNAAEIGPSDRVLIVGAASGYAAAIAQTLAGQVLAVECDPALADEARLNVPGLDLVVGPLNQGATGTFDAIVIDGAIDSVPDALVTQLSKTGRLTCAINGSGVARLAVGRRGGTGFALSEFVDSEAVPLPGFAGAKEFVF